MRAGILLRAIGSRRAPAIMLFVASTIAIAAAAIGPIFLHAADRSVVSSALTSATPGTANLTVITTGDAAKFARLARAADGTVRQSGGLLGQPVLTVDAGTYFVGAQKQQYQADVLARSGLCAHLRFTSGRCPSRTGQVAISGRSATASHLGIGSQLRLGEPTRSETVPVTVVGVYRPPIATDDAYWGGIDYFSYGTSGPVVEQLDPFVGTFGTALSFTRLTAPQLAADIPWSTRAPFAGGGALESALRATQARLASVSGLHASTGLPAILAKASHDERLMRSVVLAVVLQLVLLVLVILYALGRSTAAARRTEAEFARRHGFTRAATIALAVGEPATLIAAALPAGLLLAWAVVAIAGASLFEAGTTVSVGLWSILAGLGACAAGILAVGLASFESWGHRSSASTRRATLVEVALDAFAVALALAGLLALATHGSLGGTHTNALASFAPGLLALGAGVVGVRLALAVIRLGVRRTGESPHVAWFLALRLLARRPLVVRQALPLAAAVTIVLFAVGSFARAASNRSLLAHFDVGAARVADVSTPPGLDLERVVRAADPSGRQAMAAVFYQSSSGELLAVDSTRLANVAAWPRDLSPQTKQLLARRLAPAEPAPVVLRGHTARLRLAVPAGTPAFYLSMSLYDETYGDDSTLILGPVHPGTHAYGAAIGKACAGACRLLSLSPQWQSANAHDARTIRIALTSLSERAGRGSWRPVSIGSGPLWRATPSPARVAGTASGVVFEVPGDLLGVGGVLFTPAAGSVRVPAVVTTALERLDPPSTPGNAISLQGLDGNPLTVDAIAAVPTLPMLGTNGALVDLGLAENALTGPTVDSTEQVWLSQSAGPAVLQRLRAAGVTVGSTALASTQLAALDHGGTALAYDLVLVVTPLAALLALGTMTFDIVSDSRRRRRELASLRLVGLSRRTVRRSLLLENAVVLATALVVGAGIGIAALALALPSLPEFAAGTGRLPIPKGVPLTPVLAVTLGLALVFCLTAACTTRLVLAGRAREAT